MGQIMLHNCSFLHHRKEGVAAANYSNSLNFFLFPLVGPKKIMILKFHFISPVN